MIQIRRSNLSDLAKKHYVNFFCPTYKKRLDKLHEKYKSTAYKDISEYFLQHIEELIKGTPLTLQKHLKKLNDDFSDELYMITRGVHKISEKAKMQDELLGLNRKLKSIPIKNKEKRKEVESKKELICLAVEFMESLNSIFQYDSFMRLGSNQNWGPYKLLQELNLRVCPYCNRQYTTALLPSGKKRGTKAQFDHFFNKSTYPFFSVSFFNLVPSCSVCNADLKFDANFTVDTYIHPYQEGFGDAVRFTVKFPKGKDKVDYVKLWNQPSRHIDFTIDFKFYHNVSLESSGFFKRARNNITTFRLRHIYNEHKDYVAELILKHERYNDFYLKGVQQSLPDLNLTTEELSRIALGNYTELENSDKRPLSKLTRDLAIEFEMI